MYDRLLQLAGVDSLKELRSLPCDKIIAANAQQVAVDSSYSTFTYGPVVDHTYVGQLPGRALAQGMFDKNVKVLTGHNTNEGLSFTSPFIRDEAAFADYLKQTLAASEDRVISHITQQLYPPIYDGSKGYRDIYARISTTISESVFTCNTYHLHKALNGQSYSYIFNVPPALHGQDVPYTFYDESGKPSRDVPSQYTATVMQDYIVSFAQTGQPKSSFNVPEFEQYGSVGKTMRIDSKTVQKVSDDIVRARCDFWQQVTFA